MTGGAGVVLSTAAIGQGPVCLEGTRKRVLNTARTRLIVTAIVFVLMFTVTAGRLVELSILGAESGPRVTRHASGQAVGRADITDRNGVLLATTRRPFMPTRS
jgi:cell division protein FtsI (penicillin-binding protein 3)